MSFGMMRTNVGAKGKAQPHFNYIMALGRYAKKSDEIEYTENGNMPSWAKHNPAELWECADLFERKNGSTYREHVVGLPRELNKEQRLALVKEWITQEVGNKPYSVALHNVIASDGEQQPHIHLMFCERLQDGIERTPQQFFERYNSKDQAKAVREKTIQGKHPNSESLKSKHSGYGGKKWQTATYSKQALSQALMLGIGKIRDWTKNPKINLCGNGSPRNALRSFYRRFR